jgi:ferredoxin
MAKIKIEREKCIGCGSCAALCPKYFEMADDGKSSLIGGNRDASGNDNLETEKIECAEAAADACPVQCIHVEK